MVFFVGREFGEGFGVSGGDENGVVAETVLASFGLGDASAAFALDDGNGTPFVVESHRTNKFCRTLGSLVSFKKT